MEFEVKTDLSVLPAVIESNADEVKAQLAQALEKYKTIAVTPETVKQAKSDKADLNKLRTAIEERRKEIKRQCLAPYEAFEVKCKEIISMIDEPISIIDSQLKAITESVVIQKRDLLQEYFDNILASMEQDLHWIELSRILNPKWKNSTMKLDTLKKEIWDTVFRMSEEMQELQKIYGTSPLFPAIWGKYLESYDKGQTLAYAAVLIQQRRVAADEMPSNAPVAQSRAEVTQVTDSAPQPVPDPVPMPEPVQDKRLISGTFRVTGTKAQLQALSKFMKQSNIQFEIVRERV